MPGRKPIFSVNTLHQQLKDEIFRRIRNQDWRPGAQLPSEITLAEEFGVSVGTVRKVLDELERDHVVERKKGRGTFVKVGEQDSFELRFFRLATPGNRVPSAGPATLARRHASDAEREHLRISRDEDVVHIYRLRHLDDTPVMTESISVPSRYVPGLEASAQVPSLMLLHYYVEFGVIIQKAEEKISAIVASDEYADRLGVELGSPLLKLDRLAFDSTGRVFEWRIRICTPAAGCYIATVE